MSIGNTIKVLRGDRQLSQEQLADQLGVSRQAVSKWEVGQSFPTTENLLALADLFQVPLEHFTSSGASAEISTERTRGLWVGIITALLLCGGFLGCAIYGRVHSTYSAAMILVLVCISASFMLLAFLPILIILFKLLRSLLKPTEQ